MTPSQTLHSHLWEGIDEFSLFSAQLGIKLCQQVENISVHLDQGLLHGERVAQITHGRLKIMW